MRQIAEQFKRLSGVTNFRPETVGGGWLLPIEDFDLHSFNMVCLHPATCRLLSIGPLMPNRLQAALQAAFDDLCWYRHHEIAGEPKVLD